MNKLRDSRRLPDQILKNTQKLKRKEIKLSSTHQAAVGVVADVLAQSAGTGCAEFRFHNSKAHPDLLVYSWWVSDGSQCMKNSL